MDDSAGYNEAELQTSWPQRNTSVEWTWGPGTVTSSQGCPFVIKYQCPPMFSVGTDIQKIQQWACFIVCGWVGGGSTKIGKIILLRLFPSFVFHREEPGSVDSFSFPPAFFFFFVCVLLLPLLPLPFTILPPSQQRQQWGAPLPFTEDLLGYKHWAK